MEFRPNWGMVDYIALTALRSSFVHQPRSESSEPIAVNILDQLPKVLRQVADRALQYLQTRLKNALKSAANVIDERALDAEEDDERERLQNAAARLRADQATVMEIFVTEFLTGFMPVRRAGRRPNGAQPDGKLLDVQVLNGDAFDLSVAVSTLASRSASKHKMYLDEIVPALNRLAKEPDFSSRRNPLSVFRITGVFMTAIGRLGLDTDVQRLLLDEFEAEVIDSLGSLYGEACRVLKVPAYIGEDPAHDSELLNANQPADDPARSSDVNAGPAAGVTFDGLRGLLHGGSAGLGHGQAPSKPAARGLSGPTLSGSHLIDVLAGLDVAGGLGQGRALDLRDLASRALAGVGEDLQQVEAVTQDTLRLVSLLFEHILNDNDLSIPIAIQISRLQIAVLHVAIVDKTLFSDSGHPVRKLINRLADAGIGWSYDPECFRQDPLYQSVDRIITRLVEEPCATADMFLSTERELAVAVSKHESRAQTLETRLAEREQGKAKLQAARAVVQDLINARASGLNLPEGIIRFVKEAWSQVMIYLCVKHGVDGEAWCEVKDILGEILANGQPAGNADEIPRRAERLPFLLERIEHWLHSTGVQTTQIDRHIDALYAALQDLQHCDEEWFSSTSEYEVRELGKPGELQIVDLVPCGASTTSLVSPELEPYLSNLKPGTWVEFVDGDRAPYRCKLSMVYEQSRNHLFVDHRGLRACEITANEVAEAVRDERLRELQADPVVERALDQLLLDLQTTIRQAAGLTISGDQAGANRPSASVF